MSLHRSEPEITIEVKVRDKGVEAKATYTEPAIVWSHFCGMPTSRKGIVFSLAQAKIALSVSSAPMLYCIDERGGLRIQAVTNYCQAVEFYGEEKKE